MAFEWEWLRGTLDDPLEGTTFAALRIVLNGQVATLTAPLLDHALTLHIGDGSPDGVGPTATLRSLVPPRPSLAAIV